jgi:hypothetical protein
MSTDAAFGFRLQRHKVPFRDVGETEYYSRCSEFRCFCRWHVGNRYPRYSSIQQLQTKTMNSVRSDSPTPIGPTMNLDMDPRMCRRITFLLANEMPNSIRLQQADQPQSTYIIQEYACSTLFPPPLSPMKATTVPTAMATPP